MSAIPPFDVSARAVMERCDALGAISEDPNRLTRRYGTDAMRRVNDLVDGWMRAAGMDVQRDAVGNLIARYEAATPGAKTLLLGSHLDTVRDAGKYDGPLGVLVALASVERLHARGERLPFAIEIAGFADEEGLRFHTAYLGSRAYTGALDAAELTLTDADGIPLADAIRAFGGDPDAIQSSARRADDLLGYCEVHIEQGPVLEARGLPVGVVSAIQGQSRFDVTFTGTAGHAGTVPMDMRHDALVISADFVLVVEAEARAEPGTVATVGQLVVHPGASNVIPGSVTLSLDVRHPDDAARQRVQQRLQAQHADMAEVRGIAADWQVVSENASVQCSPALSDLLAHAVADAGQPVLSLASGAGHDAAPMSRLTEVAMLFVRCAGGVSHSPAESVAAEDVAVAVEVLERFLRLLAAEQVRL
jgi:allantoate deiminase